MNYKSERSRLRLTRRQKEIMKAICEGNKDENGATISWLDREQLMEKMHFSATRQAMVFSIRYLRNKGYIDRQTTEVRRGRRRTVYVPTELGFKALFPAKEFRVYEDEEIVETF